MVATVRRGTVTYLRLAMEQVDKLPVAEVLIEPTPASQEPNEKSKPLKIAALVNGTGKADEPPVRLGVACMTKGPLGFRTWLHYYHTVLGVHRIYLRVEDTPGLRELLAEAPWDSLVQASFHSGKQLVRDNGFAQTERQDAHVRASIPSAERDGCTHLLHCDDDELLYCPSGVQAFHRELIDRGEGPRKHGALSFHALTIEATYPRVLRDASADPFREAYAFRHQPREYSSYGGTSGSTGKAVAVLNTRRSVAPDGPHHFGPPGLARPASVGNLEHTRILPPRLAVLLHFESACIERWKAKFADSANRSRGSFDSTEEWIRQQILSPEEEKKLYESLQDRRLRRPGDPAPRRSDKTGFYTASHEMADRLQAAMSADDAAALADAQAAADALWKEWKLTPPELPTLLPGEAFRVLRTEGFTLIDVWANPAGTRGTEGRGGMAQGAGLHGGVGRGISGVQHAAGQGHGEGSSLPFGDTGAELQAALAAAKVPTSYAKALAVSAAEDNVSVRDLARGACDREALERVVKRAALPIGHRLRLLNSLLSCVPSPVEVN